MRNKGQTIKVKTTINLAQRERRFQLNKRNTLIAALSLLLVIVILTLGLIRPLMKIGRAEKLALQQEELVVQSQERLRGFDSVQERYRMEKRTQPVFNGSIDPMDCLVLIENELLNKARVSSFTVSDEMITVRLSGVTLSEISAIYQRLMASGLVFGVQVYTAATDNAIQNVTASMTIHLAVQEKQAAATQSEEGAS